MKSYKFACLVAVIAGFTFSVPATAQIREHSFRVVTTDPEASAGPVGLKRLIELVAKKSDGKIKMKLFAGSVLGNDAQMLSSIQGGTVDFGLHGSPTLVGAVKEYGVLDFPYSLRNVNEA